MADIETRVTKVEEGQLEMSQALKDFSKDFHQLTATLGEVKDVLKQMSKTETEFALFRQEFKSHADREEETFKRIHERIDESNKTQDKRIDAIERNLNKGMWTVLTAVIIGLLGLLFSLK